MRCSECYEVNPAWQEHCSRCGRPVLPLRFCPGGHLLPPRTLDCPVCPQSWPDPGPFRGPAILRGVLYVDGGRLRREDEAETVPLLELRDGPSPLALRVEGSDLVTLLARVPEAASVQVLVRPEGVLACLGPEYRGPRGRSEFQTVSSGGALRVGPILVRMIFFEVPEWVPAELEPKGR